MPYTQLVLSLRHKHGSNSAASSVSPSPASPRPGLGYCSSEFLHPLRAVLRNEVADTARGFTLSQAYGRLGRNFCRELNSFLPAFYSLGVKMQRFGIISRGRQAARCQVITSLATSTTAVANIPENKLQPLSISPLGVFEQPSTQTLAALLP